MVSVNEELSVLLGSPNRQGVLLWPKKAALHNRRAQYIFIGDRGNTWKTLRYYSFPPFSFFIHENKNFFAFLSLSSDK